MKKSGKLVPLFILLGILSAGAITWFEDWAKPRHRAQLLEKRQALLDKMLPREVPEITTQEFQLLAPNYLKIGDTQTAVRVMEGTEVIRVIFTGLSHEGYNGQIGIMASFDPTCTISHVDIISERETPGLGDQYKKNDSAWLKSLIGKKINTHWALKPEGEIDSWTGATVTPKAIIHTLSRMQELCHDEHPSLFSHEEFVYLELDKPR